jgi:hypothetical protein
VIYKEKIFILAYGSGNWEVPDWAAILDEGLTLLNSKEQAVEEAKY